MFLKSPKLIWSNIQNGSRLSGMTVDFSEPDYSDSSILVILGGAYDPCSTLDGSRSISNFDFDVTYMRKVPQKEPTSEFSQGADYLHRSLVKELAFRHVYVDPGCNSNHRRIRIKFLAYRVGRCLVKEPLNGRKRRRRGVLSRWRFDAEQRRKKVGRCARAKNGVEACQVGREHGVGDPYPPAKVCSFCCSCVPSFSVLPAAVVPPLATAPAIFIELDSGFSKPKSQNETSKVMFSRFLKFVTYLLYMLD
ncbi:hypothetical protein LXL04_008472 [Taraxacum kok-saghyz]